MNFKTKSFILILLLLFVGIGSVSASELDNVTDAVSQETYSIQNDINSSEFNEVQNTNDINSDVDSELLGSDESDVIVVNDWDELQYYCSLKDNDYILKLKENTSFYPTNPEDSNYQIKVNNKVKIIGSEGSYIGYNSSNAPSIKYAAIIVPDGAKSGISMENVNFKWIRTDYGSDGVFLQMGGNRNNVFKNCQFSYITTNKGHSTIIYLKKGTATLDNCSFIKCTTDYGCVSVYDPNSVKTTDMIVRNCYFEGNYAKVEPGCINNCGKLTVYNTTFFKNRSFWWAGAIHTHSSGNTTIFDSNFTDNVAGWNGGALYTYSYLQIYNTIFVGNNCTTNSGGGAIGACAHISKPHIYIENCLFEKNENLCWEIDELSSGTGVGGAISFMDEGSIEVCNTTFIANSAAHGTAISANAAGEYGSPNVIIKNNTFINHTRVGDVLFINVDGTSAIIEDNYFYGNSVEFDSLTLRKIREGKSQATLQVTASLTNPNYYDADILNKTLYDVYVEGEFLKTVNSNIFTIDFDGLTMCEVYVIPTISNQKSNVETVASAGSYIYVSKSVGSDDNNGTLKEFPVNTIKKALELANGQCDIVVLDGVYDEGNILINHDLTIIGGGNSTFANTTSFIVNSNNFTLKNFMISNLTSDSFIKQNKGTLFISNCIFDNNRVSRLIDAWEVSIVKSIFINNYVIVYNNGFVTIKNSILLNNTKIIDRNTNDVNLNYNWWGNTLNNISKPTDLNIDNWLCLNASADTNVLEYGQSCCVQFNCYLIENNQILKYSDLVKFDLGISALNGTVNNDFANYKSNVVYTQMASGTGVLIANYNDISFSLYFDFVKFSPKISINVLDVMYGENVVVTIIAPSDIADSKGTFKVSVGGKSQTKSSSFNKFIFNGLSAGDYDVTVIFSGNEKYANQTVTSKVNVNKYSSTTKITFGAVEVGKDLVITVVTTKNSAGNISFSVNNITKTIFLANNQATYTINNISRGDYQINAIYNGDEKYATSQDSIFLEVDNFDSKMDVVVKNSSYGKPSIVEVILNDDAGGFVTAGIDGVFNTSEVINGNAKVYIYGVDVGVNKEVKIFYTGDNTYFNKSSTSKTNITKGNFTFSVIAEDIYIGHDAVININVPAKTKGTFTINGVILSIPMSGEVSYTLNNLEVGNYTVSAIFEGDNYNSISNFTSFEVKEYSSAQWSNSGANTLNTQKSEYIANSNGAILWVGEVNSTVVSNMVIDSEGNIYIACVDGIYSYGCDGSLRWIYQSDGRSGNFSGLTIGREVIVSPRIGDTVYFINQSSGEKYGYSNIYQASSLFVPVIDSNANIYTVSEYQFETSSYNLVITPYNLWENGGDPVLVSLGNFKPITAPSVNDDILVVLGQNSMIVVNAHTLNPIFIKSGNFKNVRPIIGDGNIIYTILGDSLVAFNSDGSQFGEKISITGGMGSNLILDNDLGVYATNSYGNLYRYDLFNREETLISDLNITSGILIDDNHNLYFASNNIFYGTTSNGDILFKSDLNSKIVGVPIMDKNGVIYVTSEDNSIFALGTGDLLDSNLSVEVSDVTFGEEVIVKISLNDLSTGNVSIIVDNVVYNEVVNGNMIVKSFSDFKPGFYLVNVTYSGDMRFGTSSKVVNFTIKGNPQMDIDLSNDSLFYIKLPDDATGSVTVSVDGVIYTENLIDGKATLNISDLSNGSHNITVSYSGDAKYLPVNKSTILNVTKKDEDVIYPVLKLIGSNINMLYTGGNYYKVRLTDDNQPLVGKTVEITINGKTYSKTTDKNGYASIKISLPPKTYGVTAVYGDLKVKNKVVVKSIITAKNINAKKSAKTVKVKITLKKVNGKYLKSKVVTLKFNKKTFKVKTNKKGVATLTIKNNIYKKLKVNKKYTYQVIYGKDIVKKTIKFKK